MYIFLLQPSASGQEMGQTHSQDEDNGTSQPIVQGKSRTVCFSLRASFQAQLVPGLCLTSPLVDVNSTAAHNHSNTTAEKGDKEKMSNERMHASVSKRKRKPSMNAHDQPLTRWISRSPAPPEEQNSRPSKRKRLSDMILRSEDTHKADEEHSGRNNIPNAVETRVLRGSQRPKTSPEQPKGTTQQPKQKKLAKFVSAPQLKAKGPKTPTRQSATPGMPAKSSANKTDRKAGQGHKSEARNKVTGFFTPDEVETLESFKLGFCNDLRLSGDTFDLMVQHSKHDEDIEFPCDSNIITKHDFWQEIYRILPNRDRRSIYRFMRRHFQASTQKPHHWTEEQDEELVSLHAKLGPKFAYIAKLIGRSADDVVQRWKNRLEHRDTMQWGRWSNEEVRGLLDAVQAAYDSMAKTGVNVGKDVYEMDETLIGWGVVSDKMQNRRSRQQCADKWRKVRRSVLRQRASGKPGAVFDAERDAQTPKRRTKPATATPTKAQYKSSEYVDSGDEGERDDGEIVGQPAKSQDSTSKGRKSFDAVLVGAKPASPAERTSAKSTSPGESESESESESGISDGADAQSEKENPTSRAQSGEKSNGLASPSTAQKKDTAAQGIKLSRTSSAASASESSEDGESDSPVSRPGTDGTKPKTDREESVNLKNLKFEGSSSDSSSDDEESSSEESESDEDEQPKSSGPEPPSTSTKRKSPPATAEGEQKPTLKRLIAELAESKDKPAESSPSEDSESESETSSGNEDEESSDSGSDSGSDSDSPQTDLKKPAPSGTTQRSSTGIPTPRGTGTRHTTSPGGVKDETDDSNGSSEGSSSDDDDEDSDRD